MYELWLTLHDVPAEGREFSFSDPAIWAEPWAEFDLPYRAATPLEATLTIVPQKNGCLVSGRITGSFVAPCDSCVEDAEIVVDHSFDVYEDIAPPDAPPDEDAGFDERVDVPVLRWAGEHLELNVAAVLWEEFLLAAPVKPLCREDCKGLCPKCGANLNQGDCGCDKDRLDPRLAVLRSVKIS